MIEPVADAIAVLEQLASGDDLVVLDNDAQQRQTIARNINKRLNALRDHLNDLRPFDPIPDIDGRPWRLFTRQFRRTVAWHIARQPFGLVAGKIQYKHLKVAMFEGYAGTSPSGFPAELDSERQLAQLDSFLEQYENYKTGARTPPQLARHFADVRRELDDLPGRVVDTRRMRAMLANTARAYHPGVLNDCYFDPAAAQCVRNRTVSTSTRPATKHCQPATCANSCVSARHAPAIHQVITDTRQLLRIQRLSPLQRAAVNNHLNAMQDLLASAEGDQ